MEFSGSWDRYIPLMEFDNNSFQSSIGMEPYEALYGRKCRTPVCWTELNENKVISLDIVKDTEEKVQVIRKRLKAASDRQKSYADLKRDIAYEVGDKVFLKVSPWRKILWFGKKGKLSLRFIGPYEVLERIGPVAYRLALPLELAKLHNVFHVLMLQRYCSDESHILPVQDVQVQADLLYDEEPKAIMAREMKRLRNKQVLLVKVLWQHHGSRIAVGRGEDLVISHLLYADDTLIFCQANMEHLKYLSWILMWFEVLSGLKINLNKSEIIPIGSVDNAEKLAS